MVQLKSHLLLHSLHVLFQCIQAVDEEINLRTQVCASVSDMVHAQRGVSPLMAPYYTK